MSGKTRDHWTRLALWPLDVACQLAYGEDPKGMLPEDIRNPDIDGRPDSVSLYHQAISAIKAGTLSTVFDLEVRPAEFLAWAQRQGVPLLPELADISTSKFQMKSRLILFIHGLGGNGRSTWQSFPKLIETDAHLPRDNHIAFYNYPTSLFYLPLVSKSIKIQDLAMGLSTQITNEFVAYDSISLVCHSLGGLIARWYLMNEVRYNRPLKVTHLLLYAVPNNGAQLASLTK